MINPFEAYESERLAALAIEIAAEDAREATPEFKALKAQRLAERHAKGVRLGWWDEHGNAVEPEDED